MPVWKRVRGHYSTTTNSHPFDGQLLFESRLRLGLDLRLGLFEYSIELSRIDLMKVMSPINIIMNGQILNDEDDEVVIDKFRVN